MSEIKRVALNTLEPQKVSEKVIKKLCKTVRISVILPKSNEDSCPEYNYKDQLAAVKKKVKQIKDSNTNGLENDLDPFGDNDDDVRRIALEMEAKYGSGVTGVPKKKRKGKKDDYADIGMGYDEGDSFIDNTDGYDEIIPQNVTTLHGGFYVNSGALVFKTDDEASSEASASSSSSSESSSSDSEGEEKEKEKPKRKRILESSADSDSDLANKEKKPKVQLPANNMQLAIKKKLFSRDKIQVKKFALVEQHKKTVKDLLRAKREDLNMSMPDELKTVEDNIEKESCKENKKPMNITSVTDAIESVVKQVVEEIKYDKNQNKQTVEVATNASTGSPETIIPENDNAELRKTGKEEEVKLPDDLPADIATIVSKLKEAAINYKGEGKKAFFTKDVNNLLLNLEKRSKSTLNKSSRVKVFEHLTKYVNCTKDTLLRRAKLLELEEGEKRLINLKIKLKNSIDALMPSLKASYEEESQKVLQKKFSKENVDNEEIKSLKMPRRKFQWTEEVKKLVKDILSVKKRCLIMEGKHKDKLEEQITHFSRTVVLPLWPEGWMYMNHLAKVYNSMHENSRLSNTQKHSNISITPVANGKSSTEKLEITNSLTVTKVNSDIDSLKSEKNLNENVSTNSEKPKNIKFPDNVVEKPSDLSTQMKKNDVFKPYISEPVHKNVTTLPTNLSDIELPPQEMFKPYAVETDKNIPDKPKVEKFLSQEKDKHSHDKSKHHSYNYEKDKHSGKDKHSSHSHPDKHSSSRIHSEKNKHKHSSHSTDKKSDQNHVEKTKQRLEKPSDLSKNTLDKPSKSSLSKNLDKPSDLSMDKPSDLSKTLLDKQLDLSKFQMFKPYSETSKSQFEEPSKYRSKDTGKVKKTYSDFTIPRFDVVTSKQDAPDSGVIVKNVQQINEQIVKDDVKDFNPVIPKAVHCQGVNLSDKRKILESYKRTPELNPSSFFPVAVTKQSEYTTSSPLVNSKSDGDNQKDIQMVMENLKALQKLSCSPIKNSDNSSSSPVSVIAYNKNFSSKTSSSHVSNNDVNSRGDLSGGFQNDFQEQYINSLKQLAAASTSSSKPGYNNGS